MSRCSREHGEHLGGLAIAGNLAVGKVRRVGSPPCHHSRCRARYSALDAHLVGWEGAQGREEHAEVVLVAGRLAVGEFRRVPAGAVMVKAGGLGFDPWPRLSVTVGRRGLSEKRFLVQEK